MVMVHSATVPQGIVSAETSTLGKGCEFKNFSIMSKAGLAAVEASSRRANQSSVGLPRHPLL